MGSTSYVCDIHCLFAALCSVKSISPIERSSFFTENVVLRFNQFSGSLRDAFQFWEDLEFFDVAHNSFSGFVPPSLFDVGTLRFVYMHYNNLQGRLPANYGNPPRLRDLYLHGNQLFGSVPGIQSDQLRELTEFLLHENLFTGVMPASVCSLRNTAILEDLYADCNPPNEPEIICPRPSCCNQCFPTP